MIMFAAPATCACGAVTAYDKAITYIRRFSAQLLHNTRPSVTNPLLNSVGRLLREEFGGAKCQIMNQALNFKRILGEVAPRASVPTEPKSPEVSPV